MNHFIHRASLHAALGAALLLGAATHSLDAQARKPPVRKPKPAAVPAIDPLKQPELGPAPAIHMPKTQDFKLANGLSITLVEMHEVPIVQVMLEVNGGARTDERLPGLATFTADMLDEGAGTRDALGISARAEFLGATLRTSADWDAMRIQLTAPKRTVDSALALMSDVALRPTFAAGDIARQRALRLSAILQQRDQPNAMAQLAFNALVYPQGHPYHRSVNGDSASTVALDSAAVRAAWADRFVPANAKVIITGDVTLKEARALVDRAFGTWTGPSHIILAPAAPALEPRTLAMVYLVDKPGAAQSVICIGGPGVERSNPDYFAITVMNTILGGSFSSRLNQTLREDKGFTYGAGSGFTYRPLPGPFVAQSAVRTNVTDSSLIVFFTEFRRLRDSLVSPAELARAQAYLALGLSDEFESTGQVLQRIDELQTFGLPATYYDGYSSAIMAVTADDVQRAARTYVTPDQISVVVVGDVQKIRPGIEALMIGPVSLKTITGDDPIVP